MLYSSAPAHPFVGVFDHRSIASQILYSRLQTPYFTSKFPHNLNRRLKLSQSHDTHPEKTKKNKKVTHAKDTGAGKNTGICGPKLD